MTCELFDSPFQWIFLRNVGAASINCLEIWIFNVIRNWNKNFNIGGSASLLVVAFNLDQKSDFGSWWVFHNHIDWKQRFDPYIKSVTHELELSIGRNESNQPFILKSAESDTLMELDIVEFNGFVSWSSSLGFVISLVVESKFEVRHSWELRVGLDDSNDFAFDDIVWGTNEHIQLFDHIQKEFVFGVLDSFPSPWNHVGNLFGSVNTRFILISFLEEGWSQLIALGMDEPFEQFDLGRLWIPVIHHFVQ